MKVGGFVYNEKGYCINPETEAYRFKYGYIIIKVAIGKGGKWTRNISYQQTPTCGGGIGFCFFKDAEFADKQSAINDALQFFKGELEYELSGMEKRGWETNEWGERVKINPAKINAYKTAIQELKSRLTDGVQLTLF